MSVFELWLIGWLWFVLLGFLVGRWRGRPLLGVVLAAFWGPFGAVAAVALPPPASAPPTPGKTSEGEPRVFSSYR